MKHNIYEYDGVGSVPDDIINVRVRDGVTEIANNAFWDCRRLKSIHIPGSVERIGNCAFSDCRNLVSINLPSSIKEIGDGAFQDCKSIISITLQSINIPDSEGQIGRGSFLNCRKLLSIYLPSSIKEIGEYAFSGCNSLTSITLPSNIDHIGNWAFGGCRSLREIKIYSNNQGRQTECKVHSIPMLHFLLIFGHVHYYKNGIRNIMDADKSNLETSDPLYSMCPFLLSACTPRKGIWNKWNYDEKEHLETVFVLLREAPSVIRQLGITP